MNSYRVSSLFCVLTCFVSLAFVRASEQSAQGKIKDITNVMVDVLVASMKTTPKEIIDLTLDDLTPSDNGSNVKKVAHGGVQKPRVTKKTKRQKIHLSEKRFNTKNGAAINSQRLVVQKGLADQFIFVFYNGKEDSFSSEEGHYVFDVTAMDCEPSKKPSIEKSIEQKGGQINRKIKGNHYSYTWHRYTKN